MKKPTPSRTAVVVAKSVALMDAREESGPDSLSESEAGAFAREALRNCGRHAFLCLLKSFPGRWMIRAYERLMIPGLATHQVRRKRYLQQQVVRALESGIRRVFQVGAGFDSLCWRLHREWPGVSFVELDHPATQSRKREVLRRFGWKPNLSLREINLKEDSAEDLSSDRAILVIEGVFMYLPVELVRRWLHRWSAEVADGSRIHFTFLDRPGFDRQNPLVNWWLRQAGEPFQWHASRDEVESLLLEAGWRAESFHATWQEPDSAKVAAGEWIAVASRLPS